jgi:AcrR family transcriptional regulator
VSVPTPNPHGGGSRPARRRPVGVVLEGLIAAGVGLARVGGPDAVVLREATRSVGVSPNAAYRHFADRGDLLAAVASEAMRLLAARMERDISAVTARPGTMKWARARLRAVGLAYLAFARDEPGLFQTAFATPAGTHAARSAGTSGGAAVRTPLHILEDTLDELVASGALPRVRRGPAAALAWSTVHGLAALRLAGALDDRNASTDLDSAIDGFIQRGL